MWRIIICASFAAVTLFTIYCLLEGITIVFMHLYYFPIILLAYHYRRKGVLLATLVSLSYVFLVIIIVRGQLAEFTSALSSAILFIIIAALIAFLAENLDKSRNAAMELAHIQETTLMNAQVWLMLIDRKGTVLLWNTAAEQISGYSAKEVLGSRAIWKLLYPDSENRRRLTADIQRIIGENNYLENLEAEIQCKDGGKKIISWNTRGVPSESGKEVRYISIGIDITERRKMEEKFQALNRDLEQRVTERTEQLNASLKEKEVLLREIHHRVKNNLQIIVSLIRLQRYKIADPLCRNSLSDTENRVRSMAIAHEKLYLSGDLAHIDFNEYLRSIVQTLQSTYQVSPGKIRITIDLEKISLEIEHALPLGLIFNELISNALKYAFPDERSGEIHITGSLSPETLRLEILDDGVGFPAGFDWKNTPTLGLHLVNTLIEQVWGTIELVQGEAGTHFVITVPLDREKGKT